MAAGKVPAARTTTGTVAAARVAKVAAAKMATLNVNKTAARLTKPPALPPPRPRSCCKRVATLRGSVALAVAKATPPMRSSRLLVPKAQAVQMIANKRQQIANKRQQLQMVPPVSKAMWKARGTQHPTVPKATLTAAVADGSRGSIVQKQPQIDSAEAAARNAHSRKLIVQKQPQSQPAPATECGQILSVARSFQLSVARLYSLIN